MSADTDIVFTTSNEGALTSVLDRLRDAQASCDKFLNCASSLDTSTDKSDDLFLELNTLFIEQGVLTFLDQLDAVQRLVKSTGPTSELVFSSDENQKSLEISGAEKVTGRFYSEPGDIGIAHLWPVLGQSKVNSGLLSSMVSDVRKSYESAVLLQQKLDKDNDSLSGPQMVSKLSGKYVVEDDEKTSTVKRWGDYSSDEEEGLTAEWVNSTSGSVVSKKNPGVTFPGDFPEIFPLFWKKIQRICSRFNWESRLDPDVLLRRQGIVPFKLSEKERKVIFGTNVSDLSKMAVQTILSALACLTIRVDEIASKGSFTHVAVSYVCSLLAEEKIFGPKNKDYRKIALKNQDGGKATFLNRCMSLTLTGSSAVKLLTDELDKLLRKIFSELNDDEITPEVADVITKLCFTSTEGMIANSCPRQKTTVLVREKSKTRGRGFERKVERVKIVFPDLAVSRQPLKPNEFAKLKELKRDFDNRKAVVEHRMAKMSNPDIFDKPRVCLEVVHEAQQKLSGLRAILKSRIAVIRQKATEANNGKKPLPGHWEAAKADFVESCSPLPDSIFESVKWSEI